MGRRGLVLSTKVDWLASIRWNCPPRPPRGQVGTPPNRPAEKVCGQPGNYVIRALPAAPSPPELAEKIHCYRGSTRHADLLREGRARTQPFLQLRPPPPTRDVAYRDGDRLFLTDQHDQPFAARYAGVEQVPLQHRIVLGHDRDNDGWIFGALALVDRGGISRNQHVEFTKSVGDGSAVETSDKFSRIRIDIVDVADVAVIDLLVVVVLDLHHLIAGREGPAEALDLTLTRRVQRRLQFDVERSGADATAIHRAQNLDVANGIEAEAAGNLGLHQLDDTRYGGFGIIRLHEVEVAVRSGRTEIGDRTLVDAVGAGDDAALRSLPEHLGQAHHRHGAR